MDFLKIPQEELSVRTTYAHMIELHGPDKHVDNMWDLREEAYIAKSGAPVSTGQYPIHTVATTVVEDKKIVALKKPATSCG